MNETIQILKAALAPVTAVTAVVGCWLAIRQYQIKRLDLQLARYDKRFKVYQALKDFIAEVIADPKISPNSVRQFDIATNEASFLFEKDICEYLALVRQKSQEMGQLSLQIQELLADSQINEKRTQLVQQKVKLADWFFDQFHESKNKFEKYLSVRDKKWNCWLCSYALVLALVGLTAFAPDAFSQTAMNVAKKAFPSVVMIVMEDANGQPNTIGSGFFVRDGVVASNFHVIEGASRGFVKIIGDKTKYDIDGVLALDEFHDLVLLQVKAATAPLLSLGDSKKLAIGEEVFAVGNPQGLEGTFSQGIVSSVRELEGGSLVQITAPISPGSSGGPVLDDKAEVIGVTVATYKSGQNLNFAIPSQYLTELLTNKGDLKPIQSSSKRVTKKSVLNDLGEKSTEGVVAKRFEWQGTIGFKFSVVNQLRQPIKSAQFLVIFYDGDDQPVDFKYVTLNSIIPAGLATWTDTTFVDISTGRICSPPPDPNSPEALFGDKPKSGQKPGRWEVRVLGFELVDEQN